MQRDDGNLLRFALRGTGTLHHGHGIDHRHTQRMLLGVGLGGEVGHVALQVLRQKHRQAVDLTEVEEELLGKKAVV